MKTIDREGKKILRITAAELALAPEPAVATPPLPEPAEPIETVTAPEEELNFLQRLEQDADIDPLAKEALRILQVMSPEQKNAFHAAMEAGELAKAEHLLGPLQVKRESDSTYIMLMVSRAINEADPNYYAQAEEEVNSPLTLETDEPVASSAAATPLSAAAKKKKKSKDWDPNPWAVCTESTGDHDQSSAKFERCVKHVKEKQASEAIRFNKAAWVAIGKRAHWL